MGLSWLKRIKKERGSGKLDSSSSAEVDERKEIRETEEGPLAGSSPLPAARSTQLSPKGRGIWKHPAGCEEEAEGLSLSTAWEVEGKPLRDPCICGLQSYRAALGQSGQ